eukprot:30900-Eustigmatos_ZCMA.PRE.1
MKALRRCDDMEEQRTSRTCVMGDGGPHPRWFRFLTVLAFDEICKKIVAVACATIIARRWKVWPSGDHTFTLSLTISECVPDPCSAASSKLLQ